MPRMMSHVLLLAVLTAVPLLPACSDPRSDVNAATGAAPSAAGSSGSLQAQPSLARADFEVEGMDCGGCVIGTRAALRKLDGVDQADATYDDATGKGTAWALYDPETVTAEQLLAAIRELGYTPSLVGG